MLGAHAHALHAVRVVASGLPDGLHLLCNRWGGWGVGGMLAASCAATSMLQVLCDMGFFLLCLNCLCRPGPSQRGLVRACACAPACTLTGTMGLKSNMTAGEIIEQLVHARAVADIRNIVFMVGDR